MDLSKKTVFILSFLLIMISAVSQNNPNFKRISPTLNNVGMSINKMIPGPYNTIWMVCNSGILIYDGYDYRLISNAVIFPNGDLNNQISKIEKDDNGNIWLLSQYGSLSMYNESTGTFSLLKSNLNNHYVRGITTYEKDLWYITDGGIIYKYSGDHSDSITTISKKYLKKPIQNVVVNRNKNLFFSTLDGKIYNYNILHKSINEIEGVFTDFPGNLILEVDNTDKLWVGTETYGLFVYDIEQNSFIQNTFFKKDIYNIKNELFLSLYFDSNGFIWGGTDGGGLYRIHSIQGDVELFSKDVSNEFSLSSNTILNISEDNHKNIWIATNYGVINVLSRPNTSIKYHSGSVKNVPQRILSILKSSNGTLWLGTDGSGVTKINSTSQDSRTEEQYFNNVFRNKGFYVQSIAEDDLNNIWFGTYKNGLWNYNSKNKTFKKIDLISSKNHHATDVRTVFNDSKGRIWVASNISLSVYTSDLKLIYAFEYGYKGLEGTIIESIYEDENERLWFGAPFGGFYELVEKDTISNSVFINHIPEFDEIMREAYIPKSMTSGGLNIIWFINRNGKLIKYNSLNKVFEKFENIEALNNHSLVSIVSEDNNNLWMSSNHGISHFNIKDSSLESFYNSDGFEDNIYLGRSVFKDKQGTVYFGGIRGVNYFKPNSIQKQVSKANLYINNIEVLNRAVDSIFPVKEFCDIYNIKELNLQHDQASFSFRFSAVDNLLNQNYYYTYKLKGFDKDWIRSHPERVATYTNIPPGDYVFEVKAGTVKGMWDIKPRQIKIKVTPPYWRTDWAYLFYLIGLILLAALVRRWYLFRNNMLLEKVHFIKEHELSNLKMDFFTKMSHEIQTPITLILGPIDDMIIRAEKNGNLLLKQRLNIIANNTNRLSKIARDLTLVRDKELKQLRLSVTKNNVYNDIEDISLSFRELSRKKQIDFVVNCPQNLSESWYDKDKIEHVIYNLLSNAFKFTPREGNIRLGVTPFNDKKTIKIDITDSGPGISKGDLEAIFNLFYQSKEGKKQKGSGIGLALTKEIIDMHNGSIEVNSSAEEGTSFIVILPISEDSYLDEDKIVTNDSELENLFEIPEQIINKSNKPNEADVSKKTILIVEDNLDLQEFLKDLLITKYNILLADNGEEGYHYAKTNYPDLILSDITMPGIDGVTMSKMLQKDSLTKHIPVILITANNSINSKISGLKSGAIEYINKPFNTNELLLKVKNIISSKEHIISKYRAEAISNPEVTIEKSKDEVFLESLMAIVNSKLTDSDLKMEELADSLNMSYSSFYRKCQALTGHSIIDFVRLIRLKKAAVILAKFGYSISEVAFMVGFNDPKYFSKCFKKQFGKTPKVFSNEAKQEGAEIYLKYHGLSDI
ncbi:two-component system sensor histidine kinase/res ponse regulator hybrid [Formosa agariphila KMM 3901]|uniref:histidine kinase n=1 Tax=Formosa agariphila (strain DSM 15362 / KCTC 12365 / LMG 23005 / KMM 3901 / M-2Alg 35-1) TaxID=1347342 RepID=T2KQU0_FORAG|nr:two-component regulator propeller domain-containing protein [Formosa agariphila]CDF80344.1 two-component system sensor histidine kinase/res ponse regulator hybrid [Formosa agariphila KMM 3901]